MQRGSVFALGLVAAAALLLRSVAACSTNSGAGSPDAGEDASAADASAADAGETLDAGDGGGGGSVQLCNGGCLCYSVDACPSPGCYLSQSTQFDGSSSEPYCSNGIVECGSGGGSRSFGEPSICPGLNPPGSHIALPDYPVTYLDGGPDGAFCCNLEHEYALIGDAAVDTGTDASDGAPSACTGSCFPG